jgi:hypothetical protein
VVEVAVATGIPSAQKLPEKLQELLLKVSAPQVAAANLFAVQVGLLLPPDPTHVQVLVSPGFSQVIGAGLLPQEVLHKLPKYAVSVARYVLEFVSVGTRTAVQVGLASPLATPPQVQVLGLPTVGKAGEDGVVIILPALHKY